MNFRIPSRQERVNALRAQIEAGTYAVNPHALADALFEHFFGAGGEFVQDLGSSSSVSPQDEALAG